MVWVFFISLVKGTILAYLDMLAPLRTVRWKPVVVVAPEARLALSSTAALRDRRRILAAPRLLTSSILRTV